MPLPTQGRSGALLGRRENSCDPPRLDATAGEPQPSQSKPLSSMVLRMVTADEESLNSNLLRRKTNKSTGTMKDQGIGLLTDAQITTNTDNTLSTLDKRRTNRLRTFTKLRDLSRRVLRNIGDDLNLDLNRIKLLNSLQSRVELIMYRGTSFLNRKTDAFTSSAFSSAVLTRIPTGAHVMWNFSRLFHILGPEVSGGKRVEQNCSNQTAS